MDGTFMRDRLYLLLVEPGLVATDLTGIISEADLHARVVIARDIAAAHEVLTDARIVASAILDIDPDHGPAEALARAVAARGGRVVLIGDAAEDKAERTRWLVLQRPFTTETVLAVLDGVCGPAGF